MTCSEIYKHVYLLFRCIKDKHVEISSVEQVQKYEYRFSVKCIHCDYIATAELISHIAGRICRHLERQHNIIIPHYPMDARKIFNRNYEI